VDSEGSSVVALVKYNKDKDKKIEVVDKEWIGDPFMDKEDEDDKDDNKENSFKGFSD
jgi:hypothetical protein